MVTVNPLPGRVCQSVRFVLRGSGASECLRALCRGDERRVHFVLTQRMNSVNERAAGVINISRGHSLARKTKNGTIKLAL